MDNNSASSGGVSPTLLPCNISKSYFCADQNTNDTLQFPDVLWPFDVIDDSKNEVMQQCNMIGSSGVWFSIKVFILLTGLPANVSLLWLLMSSKEALSASEVLGLNLSFLDILYCLCLPVDIYTAKHYNVSKQMLSAGDALFVLNLFGCLCGERCFICTKWVTLKLSGKLQTHFQMVIFEQQLLPATLQSS